MSNSENPHKVLKDELMKAYMEAGEQERKHINELRKFRTQVPLVAITVLTAVTPFAKEQMDFMFAFFVAYVLLFLSTIFGVLGIEGLLRYEIKYFGQFQSRTRKIIEEFKQKKDINEAMRKFGDPLDDNLDEQLFSRLSELSITFFLIGLAILFISVFPWSMLFQFFREIVDKKV